MRFNSKPVQIEATQFMGPFSFDEMVAEWGSEFTKSVNYVSKMNYVQIHTLEGVMTAHVGDWIVRGTEGEFYPCKDSVFKRKYEPAPEPERSGAV